MRDYITEAATEFECYAGESELMRLKKQEKAIQEHLPELEHPTAIKVMLKELARVRERIKAIEHLTKKI